MTGFLDDLHAKARAALDPVHYDYFAGGAGAEAVLAANEAAFRRLALLPRVLRDNGNRELGVELPGGRASMPVFLAPTAFHKLAHPDGELATARAASAAGTILVSGVASTTAIEDITAAVPDATVWFQLYPLADEDVTADLVRRAEDAGCTALVVTVDSPAFGRHRRDHEHGFHDLPAGLTTANMRGRDIAMAPLSWSHVDRLRDLASLPVWLKGILHPADAELAIGHGMAGVIVSNHGGRQLDVVPASIDALPAVVSAVDGRVPVLLDGGVRCGGDVAKALALGAAAVGIGRPVLWGLAADGEAGVTAVLEAFRDDFDHVLTLCGGRSPADLTPDMVARTCG